MTDNTTKERPILFSASMVNAILKGRKTMTRRVIKVNCSGRAKAVGSSRNWHLADPDVIQACPYGKVGDALWVRETFRQAWKATTYSNGVVYRSDSVKSLGMDEYSNRHKWKPSIFMPRWASRITLEITSVNTERLQDISEEDAVSEGVTRKHTTHWPDGDPGFIDDVGRRNFSALWESINGKGSWELNPWCWVIEFNRIPV